MAPIHDTDLAEDRWAKTEWEHYELWEKLEVKLRRRKWLWIAATAGVFVALSAVPRVLERSPSWKAMGLSRKLAEEVNQLKLRTALEHQAFRLRFTPGAGEGLGFTVERMRSCSDPATPIWVRSGSLDGGATGQAYTVLTPEQGAALGIPGLITSFCYDPLQGSELASRSTLPFAFAIAPVKDLAELRADRVSVVTLAGGSAEISFE